MEPPSSERRGGVSPLIPTILAVLGFLFGVFQYVTEMQAHRKADTEARDMEFMKPLWEKELDYYFRAADLTATIATTTDAAKRMAAEEEFWKLDQGPLRIVESRRISDAMADFGHCVDKTEICDNTKLKDRSRALAAAMQHAIEDSANTRLSALSKDKYQYHNPEK